MARFNDIKLQLDSAMESQPAVAALTGDTKKAVEQATETAALKIAAALPEPDSKTSNAIWLIIIGAFALVLLYSTYILGSNVTTPTTADKLYLVKSETILTLFTTVVGFLAGLMSPSPIKK